jgi:hypothetical protein
MLTSSNDGETMRKAFDAGIIFFLGKPFSRESVRHLLRAAKGPMAREHLRYIRLPYRTTVDCSWDIHSVGGVKSESHDISEGGMRLSPVFGRNLGQEMTLTFSLPDTPQAISVKVNVVRNVPDGGIGVEFMALPAREKAAIRQYICTCDGD